MRTFQLLGAKLLSLGFFSQYLDASLCLRSDLAGWVKGRKALSRISYQI